MQKSNRRWWALIGVSLATFMTYLDNNVVNVALPSIQRDLNLSIAGLEWVVSSYILVFAGLMLAGGRLADVFGRKLLFLGGMAVFTLASLVAGVADGQTALILARVLQGVGAAAAIPTTLAIIAAIFPDPGERAKATGIWGAVGALALALGPLIGGFISERWDWGWIFLINIPFGIASLAITALTLDETRAESRRSLDYPGLATSATGLFTLTYALIQGHERGWTSPVILGSFAVAAAALIAFAVIETRTADPMVNMSLFSSRVFSGGLAAMVLWGFGVMGIYFFTAMYLQNVLAFGPTEAGAAFVPMALSMAVFAAVGPQVAKRIGTSITVAGGISLIVAGMLATAAVGEHGSFADLLIPFICFGVGSGFTMTPLMESVLGELPPAAAGAASAVVNTGRELSGLLGVTIVGAVLTTRSAAVHEGTPLHAFLVGYRFALIVAAAIVAVGVPIALWTLRPRRPAPSTTTTPELTDTPEPAPIPA
ncbi:MAG: MFS transporter [Mycobacteriaceae bacterium]|nr:MFS transporter [Mycobacteriaceae bacterium]